jgi:hypothetical protein
METCIIEDHRSIKGKYSFINDSAILYPYISGNPSQKSLVWNLSFQLRPSPRALTPARIKRFMAKAATWVNAARLNGSTTCSKKIYADQLGYVGMIIPEICFIIMFKTTNITRKRAPRDKKALFLFRASNCTQRPCSRPGGREKNDGFKWGWWFQFQPKENMQMAGTVDSHNIDRYRYYISYRY